MSVTDSAEDGATQFVEPTRPFTLERKPESVAELSALRHSEVKSISDRLGRLSHRGWDRVRTLESLAVLLWGASISSAVAYLPFRATSPSHQAKVYYALVLVALVVLSLLLTLGRWMVKSEREESIDAIKQDLDSILSSYGGTRTGAV